MDILELYRINIFNCIAKIKRDYMASVRWADLFRWSLVDVEFGDPQKDIYQGLDCVNIERDFTDGINADNEFSHRHMAIILSKNLENNTLTVVPLTAAKPGDEKQISKIVLEGHKYRLFLNKDTSILIDNIVTIDKKARIQKIRLKWIPRPIRKQIQKAMFESFK